VADDGTSARRGVGRRFWLAGAVVVAVALIAATTSYAFTRHSPDRAVPHAQPSQQHGSPCGLRVTESAIIRKDYYSAGAREQSGDRFFGSAIVANPCRRAAVNAKFAVSPLDEQGHVLMYAGRPVQVHFTITLIMPGARVGSWTSFGHEEATGRVASLKVQAEARPLNSLCWVDPATAGSWPAARASKVTVGKRDTSRSVTNGLANVAFTVGWSPAHALVGNRSATVIFRDSSGKLLDVGGKNLGADVKRGQRVHFVAWVPADADPARTEVTLDPEPDAPAVPITPWPGCRANP
jgi:hypothetical protein